MKLKLNKGTAAKRVNRLKKKIRIRKTVTGTSERPRLCVYRSARHMYAQIIDDVAQKTLVSTSSLTFEKAMKGKDEAKAVGEAIAKLAATNNIKNVGFDRKGVIYHGRIQAVAVGARG
ncbi:MAG: 50S ribosomal protein L18, partial [Pseudobdellovibrionaceae bacterium]